MRLCEKSPTDLFKIEDLFLNKLYYIADKKILYLRMGHRGKILEEKIRDFDIPISQLSKKLNISRNTLYNRFKDEKLSLDFIQEVGKIIDYDFGNDFKEIKDITTKGEDIENIFDVDKDFKKEYGKLLLDYQKLLKEYVDLSQKYQAILEERLFSQNIHGHSKNGEGDRGKRD